LKMRPIGCPAATRCVSTQQSKVVSEK
jgi:hypothetical protein